MFKISYFLVIFFITSPLFSKEISDSKIQGRLNIVNGASAECVMHFFYKKSGWVKIEGEIGPLVNPCNPFCLFG